MTAKEMFELAKAGYKPSEIAEMHKLMKDADIEVEAQPQTQEEPTPEPNSQPDTEPTPEPNPQPEIDYKKMYEEVEKKLAAVQKANLSQNMGAGEKNDEDILASTIRSFM